MGEASWNTHQPHSHNIRRFAAAMSQKIHIAHGHPICMTMSIGNTKPSADTIAAGMSHIRRSIINYHYQQLINGYGKPINYHYQLIINYHIAAVPYLSRTITQQLNQVTNPPPAVVLPRPPSPGSLSFGMQRFLLLSPAAGWPMLDAGNG